VASSSDRAQIGIDTLAMTQPCIKAIALTQETKISCSRPFESMADRTQNQVLDDGLDRSGDFFPPVPMTNLIDGFFIARQEVKPIMTRNGSGECRTAMGGEAGELSFVAAAAEPASLGGETIGHRDAVAARMRDRQPAIVTIETFEATSLQQPDAVTHIVADAVTGVDERIVPIRAEQAGKPCASWWLAK
jgi:hypothetical protein